MRCRARGPGIGISRRTAADGDRMRRYRLCRGRLSGEAEISALRVVVLRIGVRQAHTGIALRPAPRDPELSVGRVGPRTPV